MDRHLPIRPDGFEMRRFPTRSPDYASSGPRAFPPPHNRHPIENWNTRPMLPPPRYEVMRHSPPRRFSPRPPPPPPGFAPPPRPVIRRPLSPPHRSPHYRSPPRRMYPEPPRYEIDHARVIENNSPRHLPYSRAPPFPPVDK